MLSLASLPSTGRNSLVTEKFKRSSRGFGLCDVMFKFDSSLIQQWFDSWSHSPSFFRFLFFSFHFPLISLLHLGSTHCLRKQTSVKLFRSTATEKRSLQAHWFLILRFLHERSWLCMRRSRASDVNQDH